MSRDLDTIELERLRPIKLTDEQVRWLAAQESMNGHGHSDDDSFEDEVGRAVERAKIHDEARRRLRAEEAGAIEFPPLGETLADALKRDVEPVRYLVDGLFIEGGNVLQVGGFKVGKTTATGNLVRCLVDGEPFLGVFETHFDEGRIAYLNYEVSDAQFHSWLRDLDIANPDRVIPYNLRGKRLPFWVPEVRDRFAYWCKANDVRLLALDPVGRAWRGLVDNENDNSNVRQFTDAVDELKVAAEVPSAFLVHHTGRKEHEQDAEHGRGATTLEDWMDAGWYLTKDRDGTRMFRAMGRDVEVAATALGYDAANRELQWTGQTRAERRKRGDMLSALVALAELREEGERYPAPSAKWREAIHGVRKDARGDLMAVAVRDGYVKVESGAKGAKLHSLTKKGRVYLDKHAGGGR
ncbi:MAG TPA: AAA family ATPase [Baekduia sp.]|nr:AAA family ATPase [Baekduia sp.]